MIYDKCEDCSVDSYTERDVCRACQLDDARKTINDLKQQLAKAHREGWEQAKREADSLLLDLIDVVLESKPVVQSARRAIANMPYKEPTDD